MNVKIYLPVIFRILTMSTLHTLRVRRLDQYFCRADLILLNNSDSFIFYHVLSYTFQSLVLCDVLSLNGLYTIR